MCLAIPGQIVEMSGEDVAKVDFSGVRRNVNVALVQDDGPAVGVWVLVHVGFALRILDENEAAETLRYLEELGTQLQDELNEISRSEDPGSANAAVPSEPERRS